MSGLSIRLDRALGDLLHALPELEAAAVVTIDGLPMASALPTGMHEDRVAAMSAALLSLGERAAEGLGRGALRQVYIEGERGTVYLLAAGEDAVLVGVASRGAKAGLMLYELRHTAAHLAHELERGAAQFVPPPERIPAQSVPAQAAPAQAARSQTAPEQEAFMRPRPTQVPPMPADPSISQQRATPQRATPQQATPQQATPQQATPQQATPEHADDPPGEPLPWASFSSNQAWA